MAGRFRHEEDEVDIHIHRGPSPDYRDRFVGNRLGGHSYHLANRRRDRSHERRSPSPMYAVPAVPAAPPIVINNARSYPRSYEEDHFIQETPRFLAPHRPNHALRRYSNPAELGYKSPAEWELIQLQRDFERQQLLDIEQTREKTLKLKFEREVQAKADERALAEADYQRRLVAEIERKRRDSEDAEKEFRRKLEAEMVRKEKAAEDEKVAKKKAEEKAIAEYKAKEEEKKAAEKKAKEDFERNYKEKMEKQLYRAGMSESQIARIVKEDDAEKRPIHTRMALVNIEIETLTRYGAPWIYDPNSKYHILIKRSVPQRELDIWWSHTDQIRKRRRPGSSSRHLAIIAPPPPTTSLPILVLPKRRHSHSGKKEYTYAVVREEKREPRSKSPSLMLVRKR